MVHCTLALMLDGVIYETYPAVQFHPDGERFALIAGQWRMLDHVGGRPGWTVPGRQATEREREDLEADRIGA